MSANDEVIRLVLETRGQETIDSLQKSIANYEGLMRAAADSFGRGDLSLEELLKTTTDYSRELAKQKGLLNQMTQAQDAANKAQADAAKQAKLQQELSADIQRWNQQEIEQYRNKTKAQQAANQTASETAKKTEVVTTAMVNQGNALKKMNIGNAALQASRAIEDLQFGFAGVVNNIPGVVMALGGGMGLTAAISLVGIGVNQLANHWKDLSKAFGKETVPEIYSGIEGITAKIKGLEEKPIKLAIDMVELNAAKQKLKELQSAQQAFDAFRSGRDEHQKTAGQQAEELINMTPGGTKGLADKLAKIVSEQQLKTDEKYISLVSQYGKQEQIFKDATARSKRINEIGREAVRDAEAEAYKAAAEMKRLGEERENARQNVIGDPDKGIIGSAQTKVGALFKGVTMGNDPAARAEFTRLLRQAGHDRLAGELEGVTPEAAAQVQDEEREDRAEEGRNELRDLRKGIRKQQKGKEAEKIRGALDVMEKGGSLTQLGSKTIDQIAGSKGSVRIGDVEHKTVTPEQQYEALRAALLAGIKEDLEAQGFNLEGQEKLLGQAAEQFANAARTKHKQDTAAEVKEDKQDEKSMKIRNAMAKGQVQPQIDREDAEIKRGGYVEYAANLLAQMRNAGGAVDSAGRFHKMDDAQQRALLATHMAAQVKARNPGIRNQQATDMGNVISGRADKEVENQMLGMSGSMLNNSQKLLNVSMQTAAAFTRLNGVVLSQSAAIDGLSRELDRTMRQARAQSRTALKK